MFELAMVTLFAYSTYQQVDAAKEAQDFREQQAALEKKRSDITAARKVREEMRRAAATRGMVENASANSGVSTSSGSQGALGGSMADLAGNLAFTNQMTELDTSIGEAGLGAARAQTRGTIFGAYGSVATAGLQGSGGFKGAWNYLTR